MSYNLQCVVCKEDFTSIVPNTVTCSVKCRKHKLSLASGRGAFVDKGLATSTVGAISEYLVATHLLQRGYAVFQASSPACFCDLVVIKNGKTDFIEVRTGYSDLKGGMSFPRNIRHNQGSPTVFGVVNRNTYEVRFFDIQDHKKSVEMT